ncbi:hypothetical protein [Candidatus Enterococcus palustris]|uniref:hypothetical protein n=1 Tax=Candidatus Enterococcus palustris TaxID=1834189 RepID=UPI001483AB40|nr:hypothetical protein [Enterococcus sp. 7F3_DIV0205]
MEKLKTMVISLLGLVGAISLFGGGVLCASLFILLFILSVVLEAITSHSKKTSSI